MHKLIKNEIGKDYLLTLCPTHTTELAIENAFELSALNNDFNTDYVKIFYIFKKANLTWRLFKRQSVFEGVQYIHTVQAAKRCPLGQTSICCIKFAYQQSSDFYWVL